MASEALRAGSHGPEGARAVPTLRRPMSQHPDLRHQHPEEQQAALNKGPQEELSKSLFQATRSSCFHLPVSEGQNSVPTRGPGSFQQFLAHAMVPTCPSGPTHRTVHIPELPGTWTSGPRLVQPPPLAVDCWVWWARSPGEHLPRPWAQRAQG
ncbi:uncharacterized protein LOC118611409 isoform X4 [Rousettus aegyptiacus]|uniref:uncharacterized protein LOC118611409 isoform X4 n=1 Tax=Rousettus aegyptiacus TaxID=9407 RepID=UPI00168D4129|nr:uncharacterized protein LOC118611409 isoform X4 [Rousettus aegyptiacus]